ncbi:uncharacterized protein [Ambystoma mexicanum]|uniref:uncharacterized protein isoform X2 n=1 Tax=Ambystoma mexicanum TaxID=8296 RepID=UPI0037E87544
MAWVAVLLLCSQVFSGRTLPPPVQEVSCYDPQIFEAVDLVLRKYNADKKEGHQFALGRITEAGTRDQQYLVTFEVKESSCAAHDGHEWQNCQFRKDGATGKCKARVSFSRPERASSVLFHECLLHVVAGCRGCPVPIWSDSERLQPIVRHTIKKFNDESNRPFLYAVEQITKAAKQVVAGMNYFIEYTIKETNCSKGQYKELHPGCSMHEISGTCKAQVHVSLNGAIAQVKQECKLEESCPGCPKPISSNSEELQPILKHTIQTFNDKSNHPNHFKVEQVNKATKQVVAGVKYYIEHTFRETDCAKDTFKELKPQCKMQEILGTCKSEVHVSLSGAIADIKHDCKLADKVCFGCAQPISADSKELQPILVHAVQKFNAESNQMNLFKVGQVKKATRKVVAGLNYNIEYTIHETDCAKDTFTELHSDCKKHHVTGTCRAQVYVSLNGSIASIRQDCKLSETLCVGCPKPVSSNSAELQPILKHAIKKFNDESGQPNLFKVEQVKKATSQVVAGTKYVIEYTIKETDCAKDTFKELTPQCKVHEISGTCKADVFISLSGAVAEIKQACHLDVPKPEPPRVSPCAGCPWHIEVNSTELVEPLRHSMTRFNSESNEPYFYKVATIQEATKQVVAGTKYVVHFAIHPTNCSKENNDHLHDSCHFDGRSGMKMCKSSIIVVPWLNKVEPLEVNCTLPVVMFAAIPGLSPFRYMSTIPEEHGQHPLPLCPGEPWKPKTFSLPSF